MKNLLKVNEYQSFFKFTAFRIILFAGLCTVFIFFIVFGQRIFHFYFGEGNAFVFERGNMAVHFLDVGHGDCTVVQLPDGKVAIIDGGADTETFSYYSRIKTYIDERIKPQNGFIDYVINTHPHDDHMGGLVRIMEDYNYGVFLNYENVTEGYSFGNDYYRVIFHAVGISETINNETSPIITIEYAEQVFVIAGDAGHETEKTFTELASAKAIFNSGRALTVWLRVGHHGSVNSTGIPFIDFIKPDTAVISVGTLYDHPHETVVSNLTAAGAQIYMTREQGNIAVRLDNNAASMYFAFDNPPSFGYIWLSTIFAAFLLCFINYYKKS